MATETQGGFTIHLSELDEWKLQRYDRDGWRAFRRLGPNPERLHVAPTADDIRELRESYSDLRNDADTVQERSLCYFSDALFTGPELINALRDAIRGAYHKFDPVVTVPLLVSEYDGVALFQPAREVTAAIYVHGKSNEPLPIPTPEVEGLLKVDELDYVNASNTIIRMWWH